MERTKELKIMNKRRLWLQVQLEDVEDRINRLKNPAHGITSKSTIGDIYYFSTRMLTLLNSHYEISGWDNVEVLKKISISHFRTCKGVGRSIMNELYYVCTSIGIELKP
jgi:hypothetical protein